MTGDVVQAGVVHGGVHVHNHQSILRLPHRSGPVPPRADGFQARSVSARFEAALDDVGGASPEPGRASSRVAVLNGLGGVGKTQLAADYANRAWDSGTVDLLVWVTAWSWQAVVGDFARLAADLVGVEDRDPVRGARRFLDWLATTGARWLIVLDDLQTPADMDDLWPPHNPGGRVVVTTRRRDAALRGQGRRLVEVGLFTASESVAYLDAKLGPDRSDGAPELAAALGHLLLAPAQAAAYQLDRHLTCRDYLTRWSDRRRTLVSLLPEPHAVPDQYRRTLAATWSLSIEHADRLHPAGAAAAALDVLALLDSNGIPLGLLATPAASGRLSGTVYTEVDHDDIQDAISNLARLSLLSHTRSATHSEIRVHALVQRTVRDRLAGRVHRLARVVGDALVQFWPDVERDTTLSHVLRANAAALRASVPEALWTPRMHPVLVRAGTSLGSCGQTAAAHQYYESLLVAARRQLPEEHEDIFVLRHEIAHWLGERGEPDAAATAFRDLLEDRLRVLGRDHLGTLTTRRILAPTSRARPPTRHGRSPNSKSSSTTTSASWARTTRTPTRPGRVYGDGRRLCRRPAGGRRGAGTGVGGRGVGAISACAMWWPDIVAAHPVVTAPHAGSCVS
ncbi:NB-ARC domain-containing protein [Saccharothrix sp. NPDC042600]|uniref:DUF7779 domain-containing protein n=1 Tax=Saccharothrix TaxID=2071 RepID=UPI0033E59339